MKSKAIKLNVGYDAEEYNRLVKGAFDSGQIKADFIEAHKDFFEVLKQVKQLHYYDMIGSGSWLQGKSHTLNLYHQYNGMFFISSKKDYEKVVKEKPFSFTVKQEMPYRNKRYYLYSVNPKY
jgi:hypothetical protein